MAGRPRRMFYKMSKAFDVLLVAGGQLHTAAPDKYLDPAYEGLLDDPWRRALDATMAAIIESEKLLKMLAGNAGLPEPDSRFAKLFGKPVTSDLEPAAV